MRVKPWVPMPKKWVMAGMLKEHFKWGPSNGANGAASIAALQLWITLVSQAEGDEIIGTVSTRFADLTYEALMDATGLSRKLISSGMIELEATELIAIEKIGRFNRYHIKGYEPGDWCKLPGRSMYVEKRIPAFHVFHKRAVCELHALKLYVYYAAVRDRETPFSMASFETIHARTGVPEKWIPRANAFLLNAGLLVNIGTEKLVGTKWKEPNKYYLAGYRDFFVGQKK